VRDVERSADFVEPICFAILRQLAFDLNPGNVKKIAESVLVLVRVQATETGATAFGVTSLFP
jgi:hypothetical protein